MSVFRKSQLDRVHQERILINVEILEKYNGKFLEVGGSRDQH